MSNNRIAIVTGAAQGIGRAIALRQARDGYELVISDINHAAIAEAQDEINYAGGVSTCVIGDVTELETLRRVVSTAYRLGTLSVLVNCAGGFTPNQIEDISRTEWDTTLALNLTSVFFAMQTFAQLSDGPARIVNIASIAGKGGRPMQTHYAAAKAGVISITRSAALALAPLGITVNAVCPGVIDTPLTQRIHTAQGELAGIAPEQSLANMVSKIPLGRIGTPEDVAGIVSFLCGPDAAYITGQAINVCGGLEMN